MARSVTAPAAIDATRPRNEATSPLPSGCTRLLRKTTNISVAGSIQIEVPVKPVWPNEPSGNKSPRFVEKLVANDFHGDLFYFHRNTALNANEWFNNASGIERPILLLHQFGADVGGPIIKNKTFFFGSWQENRIKQTQPIGSNFGVPRVYTSALRTGAFRFVRGSISVGGQ